jgi:hypothetical protein
MTKNKQQTEINAVEYLDKVNQFAKENSTDKPRQQTAVEWFFNEITLQYVAKGNLSFMDIVNMSQQAKEMEKQQMWEYIKKNYCLGHRSLEFHRLEFEKYYNETYGGGEQ